MLTSLRVTGLRNFTSLALKGLTRVNLLVGENNAGKTSVLEALEILVLARSLPQVLWRSLTRRGESAPLLQPNAERYPAGGLEFRHLFHGREISPGTSFELRGESSQGLLGVTCTAVLEPQEPVRLRLAHFAVAEPETGLEDRPKPPALRFIGTADPQQESLLALWDAIVLTPEEDRVIEALRSIQPDIERLASLSQASGNTGGILVKLKQSGRSVSLDSMGQGIKRLSVLAMSLVLSAGGYLRKYHRALQWERQARGRWVERQLRGLFKHLNWSSKGVDVVDPATGYKYEVLSGTDSNFMLHGRRMSDIFFRMISF